MTGPALVVAGYAVAFAIPAAVLAWPLLERAGGLRRAPAVAAAAAFWAVLVLPPAVGLALDEAGDLRDCAPGDDCAESILWWLGVPVGWLLGAVVAAVVFAGGRRRAR